jgi:hypothetical protein
MCGRTVLPAGIANHPRCEACDILLEPAFNDKKLCRCGKYHNAPSVFDPKYCRLCMGEEEGAAAATDSESAATDGQ